MKWFVFVAALVVAAPALAGSDDAICYNGVQTTGQLNVLGDAPGDLNICFSATFHYTPTFGSTGTYDLSFDGLEDTGSTTGTPSYHGTDVSIVRTLTSSLEEADGVPDTGSEEVDSGPDSLTLAIEAQYVSALEVAPPDWCPPPPAKQDTFLFLHYGDWQIKSGTGRYAGLQGTGRWVTYVYRSTKPESYGLPLTAVECMTGRAHHN